MLTGLFLVCLVIAFTLFVVMEGERLPIGLIGGIVLALLGFAALEYDRAATVQVVGVVTGRSYTPHATHVGSGVSGSGHAVVTVSSTPDHYHLYVEVEEDGIVPVEVANKSFSHCKDGTRVMLDKRFGGVTGRVLDYSLVRRLASETVK